MRHGRQDGIPCSYGLDTARAKASQIQLEVVVQFLSTSFPQRARQTLFSLGAVGCALVFAASASAQPYPNRAVKIIVLTPAGDGTDVVARAVAAKLSSRFGQPFIIENRTGGGGLISGNVSLVKAAPDGYTLLVGHTGSHGISPAVYSKLPYDLKKDQTPISLISRTPNVFVINPALPIKTVDEFIAYAKARPKQLNFGSGGNASSAHMSGELFKNMAKIEVVHVPYRGGSLALADVAAGRVEFFIGNIPPALPYIAAGKLRALAVTSDKRWPDVPSVPTMEESGLRGYETWGWAALYGPAGLPPAITRTLSMEVAVAVKSTDLSERLLKQGLEAIGSTPEELAAFMDKDIARWKKVAADSNITLD